MYADLINKQQAAPRRPVRKLVERAAAATERAAGGGAIGGFLLGGPPPPKGSTPPPLPPPKPRAKKPNTDQEDLYARLIKAKAEKAGGLVAGAKKALSGLFSSVSSKASALASTPAPAPAAEGTTPLTVETGEESGAAWTSASTVGSWAPAAAAAKAPPAIVDVEPIPDMGGDGSKPAEWSDGGMKSASGGFFSGPSREEVFLQEKRKQAAQAGLAKRKAKQMFGGTFSTPKPATSAANVLDTVPAATTTELFLKVTRADGKAKVVAAEPDGSASKDLGSWFGGLWAAFVGKPDGKYMAVGGVGG